MKRSKNQFLSNKLLLECIDGKFPSIVLSIVSKCNGNEMVWKCFALISIWPLYLRNIVVTVSNIISQENNKHKL